MDKEIEGRGEGTRGLRTKTWQAAGRTSSLIRRKIVWRPM